MSNSDGPSVVLEGKTSEVNWIINAEDEEVWGISTCQINKHANEFKLTIKDQKNPSRTINLSDDTTYGSEDKNGKIRIEYTEEKQQLATLLNFKDEVEHNTWLNQITEVTVNHPQIKKDKQPQLEKAMEVKEEFKFIPKSLPPPPQHKEEKSTDELLECILVEMQQMNANMRTQTEILQSAIQKQTEVFKKTIEEQTQLLIKSVSNNRNPGKKS